jgi:AcrB/AcrD/AcrF family
MNLSAPFIARPVATTLLTIGIALAGILAVSTLPVSALSQVDFLTISVQAQLPGASPETIATSVASALERYLGKIANVTEMTSQSGVGQTRIVPQFGALALFAQRRRCRSCPPKGVDFGDSIDGTSQLVGRLHQRHLKPTQCPTIRATSRKIDTTVRTTPTSHPTVTSLPIVFRETRCSLWSTGSGLLRKPSQDRRVLPGYGERRYEQPTGTTCDDVVG